jgi:hypothetical protein
MITNVCDFKVFHSMHSHIIRHLFNYSNLPAMTQETLPQQEIQSSSGFYIQ